MHLNLDLNKSIGGFSVGSAPIVLDCTSRKRPRRCRSPSVSEQGGSEAQVKEPSGDRNPFVELIKKSKFTPAPPTPFFPTGELNKTPDQENTDMGDYVDVRGKGS
ncbi:hypothetical protein Hanom_Chr08g00749301 [Helianthus anomalus]